MNSEADNLDQETREYLNMLLHKDVNDMSEPDKEFLRARRFYLKDKHVERLSAVFNEKPSRKKKEESGKQTEPDSALSPENQPDRLTTDENDDEDEVQTESVDDSDEDDDEAVG